MTSIDEKPRVARIDRRSCRLRPMIPDEKDREHMLVCASWKIQHFVESTKNADSIQIYN
jgi:hypothetical protein